MTEDEARLAIVDAGFAVGRVTREPSETVAADTVIEQDPNRDDFEDPGRPSTSSLSLGKPEVEVPVRRGQPPQGRARASWSPPGLKVRFEEEDSDEDRVPGPQHRPRPPARRSPRARRSTSSSPTAPSRSRTSAASGRARPSGRSARPGFVPDVRTDATSTEPKGTVVDQIPAGRHRRPGQHGDDLRVRLRGAGRRPPRRRPRRPDRDARPDDPVGARPRRPTTPTPPWRSRALTYSGIGVA